MVLFKALPNDIKINITQNWKKLIRRIINNANTGLMFDIFLVLMNNYFLPYKKLKENSAVK